MCLWLLQLQLHCLHVLRQPNLHIAVATMSPCEVRDELQGLVLGGELAALVEGEALYILSESLQILSFVEREHVLVVLGDEGIVSHFALGKLRILILQEAHDVEVVVWPFFAVYDRTTLDADATTVCLHLVPDAVDGVDVSGIASEGGYISHAGIHIGGTNGMSHCLVLLQYRFVALRVFCLNLGLAMIVEEELSLVQVFLVASGEIEFAESHLCYLVSRYHASLTSLWTHLLDHAVGVADGDVEELAATCSLPVSHGTLHHMTEVVELMTQVFLHAPALVACPEVRMLGVLGAGCVEVSIRLLSLTDDVEHTVDISLQLLVWISLEHVASTLDGLVWVGISILLLM